MAAAYGTAGVTCLRQLSIQTCDDLVLNSLEATFPPYRFLTLFLTAAVVLIPEKESYKSEKPLLIGITLFSNIPLLVTLLQQK